MIRVSRPIVTDWRTLLRELAVTFVGVLLALLATAWWSERLARRHERAYTTQLRSDLIATRNSLDSAIAYNRQGLSADSALISLMRLGPPINSDTLGKYLALPWLGVQKGTLTLGTARALSQSAEGGVISDPDLRLRITSYVALADGANASVEDYLQSARPLVDGLRGYIEQTITPEIAAERTRPRGAAPAAPLSSRAIMPRTINTFSHDPAFRALIVNFTGWRNVTNARLLELRTATDSLLMRLPRG